MSDDRRPALLALLLLVVACVGIFGAPKANAVTTRYEAESATQSGTWSSGTTIAGYSGTAYMFSSTTTNALIFSVNMGVAGDAVIGYRTTVTSPRSFRYRVDSGAWTTVEAVTDPAAWATTAAFAIGAGAHTVRVEPVTGQATIDYLDTLQSDPTTTTTTAPTTTTTEAPTTTTTEAPTTTTTAASGGPTEVCIVNGTGECDGPAEVVLFNRNAMAGFFIVVAAMAGVIFAAHTLRDPGRLDA